MAGGMKPLASLLSIVAITGAFWRNDATAQLSNDPTRPPAGMYSTESGAGSTNTAPLLQSVMITPSERSAIIGGERIKLGGKYGEARVIGINENEVILRSASGTETLRMYPDVGVKRIETATPPVAEKPGKKRRPATPHAQGKQG